MTETEIKEIVRNNAAIFTQVPLYRWKKGWMP